MQVGPWTIIKLQESNRPYPHCTALHMHYTEASSKGCAMYQVSWATELVV